MKNKITLKEFYNRASAKNIKTMRGHDGPSQEWDVYFDNKKICNVWDDSYGGELQIRNYDGKSIEDIFNTIDKESTYDKAWEWYTTLDLIMSEVKTRTQFLRDQKKGVLIGFNKHNYDIIGYKKSILDMLRLSLDYQKEYEKVYNEETDMSTGRKVINWQYLEGCEINVPKQYRWNKQDYVKSIKS